MLWDYSILKSLSFDSRFEILSCATIIYHVLHVCNFIWPVCYHMSFPDYLLLSSLWIRWYPCIIHSKHCDCYFTSVMLVLSLLLLFFVVDFDALLFFLVFSLLTCINILTLFFDVFIMFISFFDLLSLIHLSILFLYQY